MIEIRNGAIISLEPVTKAFNPIVGTNNVKFLEVRYVYQGVVYKKTLPVYKDRDREYLDFSKTMHNNLGVVYVR